jgi:hypothetical protein
MIQREAGIKPGTRFCELPPNGVWHISATQDTCLKRIKEWLPYKTGDWLSTLAS